MKKANIYYAACIVTAIGSLLVASGIETTGSTLVQLGYLVGSLLLLGLAVVLAGLGCAAEARPTRRKVHREPMQTVQPSRNRNRRAG